MSLFTRMSDIVQSNLNAMLDTAEDPKKVISLIIREMEETLVELRTITAKHLAEQKILDRQAVKLESEAYEMVGAKNDLDKEFQLLMHDSKIDIELAALKSKHHSAAYSQNF